MSFPSKTVPNLPQPQQEQPLSSSKLSFRHSTCSQHLPSSESKLNYKYQRVNNTFKLVEVSSTEDKENCSLRGLQEERRILCMIDDLYERVQRLEKQKYSEEEKLEEKMMKVLNERMEERILEHEMVTEERLQIIKGLQIEMEKEFKIQSFQLTKNQIQKEIEKIRTEVSNTLNQRVGKFTEFTKKIQQKIPVQIQKILNKAKDVQKIREKCQSPLIEFQYREKVIFSEEEEWSYATTYKIDDDGFLLDGMNYYLTDKRGNLIKLNEKQVDRMKECKMVISKK